MAKPNKELKKKILILGIAGAVYGSFRFLLPLVIPFLIAYGISLLLGPSSRFLASKLRTKREIRGKRRGIPVGVIGAVELVVILQLLLSGLYFGGKKLCMEAGRLFDQIPVWLDSMEQWINGICHQMELVFCLEKDYLVQLVGEMNAGLLTSLKNKVMPYLMSNSVLFFKIGMEIVIFTIILIIATALSLQETERWSERCKESVCRQEISIILRRLKIVCNAYLKTQGVIMLLTMCISTVAFWLLGNPYYILAGVGLGLVDALPILGTGTVLVPWAVISFIGGRWGTGLALLALYVICYFMREILEAKMMGGQVGLSPLETLIAMYVGLQLFGLPGFLLGPVGLLLIMDLVALLE
ncbi:MAG: AI-2E family transporter [Lachnospiraceae bacterium]